MVFQFDDNAGTPAANDPTQVLNMARYIEEDTAALDRIAQLPWDRPEAERRVETRIRYEEPTFNVSFDPLPTDPVARQKSLSQLSEFVSIETLNEIDASEKLILSWLAKDSANPIKFFADPVSSLLEAQVQLSPRAISEISDTRNKQLATIDPNALASIKNLNVKFGDQTSAEHNGAEPSAELKGCLPRLAGIFRTRDK
ncbi:MAG TPA: hypothetical protein VGQ41_03930 [Pyrinomonadaceae bacterium]|jgi:hypothetical protein|nr:hypothetical protein [Pyrinomonadaceae bacterium]